MDRKLSLRERLSEARIGRERAVMDRLVYELYALTNKEIGVVEEAVR